MKNIYKFIISFLFLIISINSYTLTINLKDKVFLDNGNVVLKDIANIDDDNKLQISNLFITSAYFRKITISKQFIKELIRKRTNKDFKIYGNSVKLFVGIKELTKNEIKKIITDKISKIHNIKKEDLIIEIQSNYRPIEINKGNNKYNVVLEGDNKYLGLQKCIIKVYFENKFHRRIVININIRQFSNALISKRNINKGELFNVSDFYFKTIEITDSNIDIVTDYKSLFHTISNDFIEKGKIVSYSNFKKKLYVEKEQEVKIIFIMNKFIIIRKGTSLEDGYFGKIVKIQIDENIYFAEVIGERKVRIKE